MISSLFLNVLAIIGLFVISLYALTFGANILVFIFELIDYKEVKNKKEEFE